MFLETAGYKPAMGGAVAPCVSVSTIVRDALLHFADGLFDEVDGAGAMAAFVRCGAVEIAAGGTEMTERCLHLRLGGAELTGDEADHENDEKKGNPDERPAHANPPDERLD